MEGVQMKMIKTAIKSGLSGFRTLWRPKNLIGILSIFVIVTSQLMACASSTSTGSSALAPSPSPKFSSLPVSNVTSSPVQSQATASSPTANQNSGTLSESAYKAACQPVEVSALTTNAPNMKGQLVQITGEIMAFDESQGNSGEQTLTRIILSVKDAAFTLSSGVLPVYLSYQGTTVYFIYDKVTAYGIIFGNDNYQSAQIKNKTLPRIDVKYLEKAP
jgi:hypothetical protein